MTTPSFVDISAYQGQSIDWQTYKAWSAQGDGISRVAMKATEGTSFVDPAFATNRANALAAGIDVLIFYHFSRPDINTASNEANFMYSIVGDIRPQDIVILDFEENVPQATAEWAYEWLVQQEANYQGKLPGVYASTAYIQQRLQDSRLAKYPLWLAQWQFTPDERPACPQPWTSYEFVQYTDRATNIPGISSTVDCNIFLGVEPMPQTTTIDLTNGVVASHFSGPDNTIWQCKENGFLVGHAILDFYRSFGGDALCGLTYLGLPKSNEQAVAGHSGAVIQEFERGCLVYDPQKQIDNPPGSGTVYLVHVEGDPRYVALQAQIAALQQLPIATTLSDINKLGQQIIATGQAIITASQVQ